MTPAGPPLSGASQRSVLETFSVSSRENILIDTAIEPPRATHALSIVSANPQILKRPYCRCN